jgi:hypothetical protein
VDGRGAAIHARDAGQLLERGVVIVPDGLPQPLPGVGIEGRDASSAVRPGGDRAVESLSDRESISDHPLPQIDRVRFHSRGPPDIQE